MTPSEPGSALERSVLKEGPIFLVADHAGDVGALNVDGLGLYFRDTRFLSIFEVAIAGTRLTLLSSAGELNFMSNLQFANDTLRGPDGGIIAAPRTISVRRNRFVFDGALHERLGLLNYNQQPITLTVRFTVGSDFRDMFQVRGYFQDESVALGEVQPIEVLSDGVQLSYIGADAVERHTRVTFDPSPDSVEIDDRVPPPVAAAVFSLELAPSEARSITVHVAPSATDVPAPKTHHGPFSQSTGGRLLDAAFFGINDSYEEWRSESTEIQTDNELFDKLVRGAAQDLRLLTDQFDGEFVPTAGIPRFAVPFGRDSLITSMQTLMLRPSIAAGTLRFLSRHQGVEVDEFRDEEPGKILHEIRFGELARLRRVPHSPYYGSVDSTPLFLITLGEYIRWTGDLALARELLPNAEAALAWLRDYADVDRDGLIEYRSRSTQGIRNQGWKDSFDSVTHSDGALAEPPIALAEVQAYTFAAHREMADLFARLDQPDRERSERGLADRVRQLFIDRLATQDDDGPFWAMGLDAEKRPIESVTSNPGHALWAGLLSGTDAALTVRRLIAPDMLCGWGIRTLSSRARNFNPMSYQNGSVWPHDNGLIALGMRRSGADAAALNVATEVFEAGLRLPEARMPELWCGFGRDRRYQSMPAQYPVSCSPQAWAAGSAFMLLQALLGLEVDAFEGVLRLKPVLPTWLGRISVRKLRATNRRVDFDVIREGHRVLVDVIDDGGLRIETRDAEI